MLVLSALLALRPSAPDVTFERLLPLRPDEGVFAYARISPSGRYLAYASETPNPGGTGITQTETVIDLTTKKTTFTAPGIDGYFSNDEDRLIFLNFTGGVDGSNVAILHLKDNRVVHDAAPTFLGDYYSWGVRNGRNLILTITSRYYYLDGDRAVLPQGMVTDCPGIGVGERPLISKDGTRITTFVNNNVVVRGLDHCNDVLDTGLQGAKADFSWDGRYVAFHVAKADHKGSEIVIVDTKDKTMRTLTGLKGTALFPSWTKDGRLCFRYDGDDYRGFMMASNVLSLPSKPLPLAKRRQPPSLTWQDVFPETTTSHRTNLVMIWSDWSPHSPRSLADLQRFDEDMRARGADIGVMTSVPQGSPRSVIDGILSAHNIRLPEITLRPDRLPLTGALNQIPTVLLFKDGVLAEQRLGPPTYDSLMQWLAAGTSHGAQR